MKNNVKYIKHYAIDQHDFIGVELTLKVNEEDIIIHFNIDKDEIDLYEEKE